MRECVYGVALSFSEHIYTDTQSHKCVQMVEFTSMEILGCLEPWFYGTLGSSEPWFYGTLGSSDSWVFGTLVPLDLRNLRKFGILLSVPLGPQILSVPGIARYRRSPKIQGCQFGSFGSSDSQYLRKFGILLSVPLGP